MPSNPDHSLNVFSRRLISVSRVEATNYSANDIDNDREITFKGCTLVNVKKPCGFPAEVGDGIRNTNPRFFPLSSYHYKYFFRRLSASIFNWAFNCGVRINFPFFQCTLHRLIHSRKKKSGKRWRCEVLGVKWTFQIIIHRSSSSIALCESVKFICQFFSVESASWNPKHNGKCFSISSPSAFI